MLQQTSLGPYVSVATILDTVKGTDQFYYLLILLVCVQSGFEGMLNFRQTSTRVLRQTTQYEQAAQHSTEIIINVIYIIFVLRHTLNNT